MAKFHGVVGFVQTFEIEPTIWDTKETTRSYYGDIIRNRRLWDKGTNPNEEFNVSNEVSIVADKFAMENLNAIKWVEFLGAKWMVTAVSVEYPRLSLTVGGLYNGG